MFAAEAAENSAFMDFITVHWYYAIPMFLMSCIGIAPGDLAHSS